MLVQRPRFESFDSVNVDLNESLSIYLPQLKVAESMQGMQHSVSRTLKGGINLKQFFPKSAYASFITS
jgi:hypothetical protein